MTREKLNIYFGLAIVVYVTAAFTAVYVTTANQADWVIGDYIIQGIFCLLIVAGFTNQVAQNICKGEK